MQCPKCHTQSVEADQYCRLCGSELLSSSTSIVKAQTSLPAVLQNSLLPRRVAASVGALALGVGIELLRRGLVARLTRPSTGPESTLPALGNLKDIMLNQGNKMKKLPKGYEVQETVVYMRRVIRRVH
jgi:hypothetical protein